MTTTRWDETWHRLREWTTGQSPSERLSAQVLQAEGFTSLDPSHPLGGPDGGKDAVCLRDQERWAMAVYFPRGKQSFAKIRKKFQDDFKVATVHDAVGFVFVTNQELTLEQRGKLTNLSDGSKIELFHLERLTSVLDRPALAATRKQFLGIDYLQGGTFTQLAQINADLTSIQKRMEGVQTGGDTFCHFMLYHFDLQRSIAQNIVLIRTGEFPLYDVSCRIMNMDTNGQVFQHNWGELHSPAAFFHGQWKLPASVYYRIFFDARNGAWHQDLILNRSDVARCWLAATRVLGKNGRDEVLRCLDNGFESEFGIPVWRE